MNLHADKLPWYKYRWPWLLMIGPAVVVVAGITTAWLAVVSNDGLVTDDYYKQGLAVNQSLERDQRAEDMGLQADLMPAGRKIRLLIRSNDNAGLPASLHLKLAHPTRAGHDQDVELKEEGQGFYGGTLAAEVEGRWLVSVEDPSGKWRLQGEWLAGADEPLRLVAHGQK